jgi:hypothetical protein
MNNNNNSYNNNRNNDYNPNPHFNNTESIVKLQKIILLFNF